MDGITRYMPWAEKVPGPDEVGSLLSHEWLVTNGLGGYASGTISGTATRRYHGLLIAALPAPFGRTMMLNHLLERLELADRTEVCFGESERADHSLTEPNRGAFSQFRLDVGLPVWRYEVEGHVVEKQVVMAYRQNTVHVIYRLLEGNGPVRLKLQPSVHFRHADAPVDAPLARPYVLTIAEDHYELRANADFPPLRMCVFGRWPTFTFCGQVVPEVLYRVEKARGYDSAGDLWSPGYFSLEIKREEEIALVASTESWETIQALTPQEARSAERQRRRALLAHAPPRAQNGTAAELVLAADQFLITPAGRTEDAARARAAGDEIRTVIAGYHWFTDWGRDTMISLEGLTLSTGRTVEAGYILRTFGDYVRDGLIPNLFPEGEKHGLYHTADATLWFFHALHRYLLATDDRNTLRLLLPKLIDIVEHHRRGTRFGIGVDPTDGLLREGEEGYQLTWMDAKVDGWVVTPRRGKAVEINALWYNALKLLEGWLRKAEAPSQANLLAAEAEKARDSFNRRFWNQSAGYLYDVVDGEAGDDPACRPNQLFAISLDHPVLAPSRWPAVVETVRERLLTPVGLRSLAPGHPDFRAYYDGDLRARDAAYHQGTVWSWLIGPFVDAWLKVHPGETNTARKFLLGFDRHLSDACVGSVSEIFDAEPPFTPRGCIAQAWAVAEVLRCWLKTAEG